MFANTYVHAKEQHQKQLARFQNGEVINNAVKQMLTGRAHWGLEYRLKQ